MAAKTNQRQPTAHTFRSECGISRKMLARMTRLSERTLATWEADGDIGDVGRRTLTSIMRLLSELSEVIQKEDVAAWLETPSEGFGNLKPIEIMERGEIDRVWRAIYFMGSGAAS